MKFSGDGRYLASAGQDTLVCVWQLLPARGGPPEASAADANGSDAPGAPWFRPQGQASAWHQARPVCVGAADEPACCEVQAQAASVFQLSPESVSRQMPAGHICVMCWRRHPSGRVTILIGPSAVCGMAELLLPAASSGPMLCAALQAPLDAAAVNACG